MPFSINAPTIVDQEKFTWRGFLRRDIPDLYDLMQTVNRVDNNDYADSPAELERQFQDGFSDPQKDARIVRTVKGKLAMFLRVFIDPKPEAEIVADCVCEVAPDARDTVLPEQGLEWMETNAAERLAAAAEASGRPAEPLFVRIGFPETARETFALYQAHGYQLIRTFVKMQRDLHAPIPDNPLPAGLTLRTYDDDLKEKLRHAFNESFADHWGAPPFSPEDWEMLVVGRIDLRKDLSLVVMDGDEIAAFALNRIKVEENERLGKQRGWLWNLGTRRAWRKRGIGSALLSETMRRFRAAGMDYVGLGVDTASPTGALELYERNGFKPYKTRLVVQKQLPPSVS